MVQTLAVLAALAAPSHAAPGVPVFKQSLKAGPASARQAQPRADFAEDLARAERDARALAREATSLRLAAASLRRRLDAPQAAAFAADLSDWTSTLRRLERRTLSLSTAPRAAEAAKAADALVLAADDLYVEASALAGDLNWLAFDLRGLGLAREASEIERLQRDGAGEARQLVYDAGAILSRAH